MVVPDVVQRWRQQHSDGTNNDDDGGNTSNNAGAGLRRVPSFLQPAGRRYRKLLSWISRELNFYRIHVLVFVFTPLIMAAIFYASNGQNHIPFIDCLFVCVSAMTVTGLVTINISTVTAWQQAILFMLMLCGNISAVSVTMIWVRRHFFRKSFDNAIRNNAAARKRAKDIEEAHHLQRRMGIIRLKQAFGLSRRHSSDDEMEMDRTSTSSTDRQAEAELRAAATAKKKKQQHKGPLRTDMIRRVDQPAMLINPMGMPSEGHPAAQQQGDEPQSTGTGGPGGILTNTERRSIDEDRGSQQQGHGQGQGSGPAVRITFPDEQEQRDPDEAAPRSPGRHRRQPSSGSMRGHRRSASGGSGNGSDVNSNPLALFRTSRIGGDEDDAEEAAEDGEDNAHVLVESPSQTSMVSPPSPAAPTASPRTRFHDVDPPSIRMRRRRGSDPSGSDRLHVRRGSQPAPLHLPSAFAGIDWRQGEDRLPRSQTVEFAEPPRTATRPSTATATGTATSMSTPAPGPDRGYTTGVFPKVPTSAGMGTLPRQRTFERTMTGVSSRRAGGIPITRTMTTSAKERGFGGFPTPIDLAGRGIKAVLPGVRERVMRSTTMPRTSTIASTHSFTRVGTQVGPDGGVKSAPYLSFDVNVYGNSMFHSLTEAQREELGGVEYRALDMLAKIVPAYWFCIQMFMVVLVAPYLASGAFNKYRSVFQSQGAYEPDTTWFWFFQVTSAYSNTGMSLIDTSMTGMADAYFLLIPMGILILIGNTAFPVFLRFCIWLYSRLTPKTSRTYETLRFILDHPRRCFVYLFPSGQTWFLLFVIVVLNVTDWVFFEILDIGNPEIESIPVPQRIFDGLFQSIAVRAAGFQVVSLLTLAPAVQFLYVVMMYISAYPIALSVRSTNVYEERSLGIYTEKGTGDDPEEAELPNEVSSRGWGTYLAAHARRQLAFDIWWLGFALWLVCIMERGNIQDPESNGWFTVFSCLFELTSAYGTVGLSTGTPYDAFSLSGRFGTLAKLVVIATMLRGRHRGLPVAIDRSIMLPKELEDQDAVDEAWSVMDGAAAREMERTFSRLATGSFGRGGVMEENVVDLDAGTGGKTYGDAKMDKEDEEGNSHSDSGSDSKAASLVDGAGSPESSGSGSGSGGSANGNHHSATTGSPALAPAPPYSSTAVAAPTPASHFAGSHRLSRSLSPSSSGIGMGIAGATPGAAFGLDAIQESQRGGGGSGGRTPVSEEERPALSRAPSGSEGSGSSKGKEKAEEEVEEVASKKER